MRREELDRRLGPGIVQGNKRQPPAGRSCQITPSQNGSNTDASSVFGKTNIFIGL